MRAPADANLDELKKKARRRLVGAVVLALAAAVFVPMLLESDERPLGDDVSVRIPAVDQGKFVNRLNTPPPAPAAGKSATALTDKAAPVAKPAAAAPRTTGASPAPPGDAPAKGESSAVSAPAAAPSSALDDAEHRVLATSNVAARPMPPKTESVAPAASAASADAAAARPDSQHVESAPATPARSASKSAAPSKAARAGFDVQLAAFSDDKGANALVNRLKRSGHPAFTEPVSTPRGTLWRVRVGPYASHDAAAAARDKLKREGQNGIIAARNS